MDIKFRNRISDILNPTEEQKERMFLNILEQQKNTNTKKFAPIRRFKIALVAAIVLCCFITTTAFASVYFGLDLQFLNFLKPFSDEQQECLANGAYEINKQIKNDNGTLDIKQVIGDSNLTYILMDFTAPEGTVLNSARYRFDDNIHVDSYSGFYSVDFIPLSDDNANDNKISMIMRIQTDQSLMDHRIHLKFSNLQGADPYPAEFHTVISDEWDASFPLKFKNYSTDYQINKQIALLGYPATIKTVSISPISIALKIDTSFTKEINEAACGGITFKPDGKELDNYPITIHYKDGTSETTKIFNGTTLADHLKKNLLIIKTFDNVINDKEITSITLFGTEIPIN